MSSLVLENGEWKINWAQRTYYTTRPVWAMVRMTLRVVQALRKAGNVIADNLPSLPKMLIGEVSNAQRIMS